MESSRLDYITSSGSRPYPEGGNAYGYIKFMTDDVDRIEIPYGNEFGGINTDTAPCTRNGFTSATNGSIIPEYMSSGCRMTDGAQLVRINSDGTEELLGVFDGECFKII